MVILRTIYTEEEAERRDEEEREVMEAFHRVEKRIRDFAKTKVSKKAKKGDERDHHHLSCVSPLSSLTHTDG